MLAVTALNSVDSIQNPAANRAQEEGSSELGNDKWCWWMGILLVHVSCGPGACSPGNTGAAGFLCVQLQH